MIIGCNPQIIGFYHTLTSQCVVGVNKDTGAGYMIESHLISWNIGFIVEIACFYLECECECEL